MNRRTRLMLRAGLLTIPLGLSVALVVVSRDLSVSKSWLAWLPLRDTPVTLLGCGTQDSSTVVWFSSSVVDLLTTLAAVLLAVALLAGAGLPRFARPLARIVVAMFVVELGVFANAWLERALVGRTGFDQRPYCDDTLQVMQAISRDAYIGTTMLLVIALLLVMVLELDDALSRPVRPHPSARTRRRETVVVRVLKVLLLGSAACAFGRALYLASSPVVVIEVGGLMIVTTMSALPVALAVRPAVRAVGWTSWFVGAALAVTIWCSTWAIGLNHEKSEKYLPGQGSFRTFSDLPDDQLARLLGLQHFFSWWFIGLLVLGLLGAVVERLLRSPSAPLFPQSQDAGEQQRT